MYYIDPNGEVGTENGKTVEGSERAKVEHFVEVGEYGLDLETSVDIYAEEKTSSANVAALIKRLTAAMSIQTHRRADI